MKGVYSSLVLEPEPSKAGHSEVDLERGGGLAQAKDQESMPFCHPRGVPLAQEVEEEESEGPLGEPELKEAYIQLVQGVQEWHDGCIYRGQFGLNVKLGYGEFSWPTGESYQGQFYRDHRHGWGTYTWPDGSSFTGSFYLSLREGYGTMYLKTRLFQGLYKADERFGPGIETYPDGSQDVGLWFHGHLIKLCVQAPSGFSILSFPEFSQLLPHSRARISLSDEETTEWGLDEGKDPFFYEYKRFILHDDLTLPPEMYVYSTDHGHLPMTASFRQDLDARLVVNDIPPLVEDGEPWLIINETPLMVRMQKQVYKFRHTKAHGGWHMGAILEGSRGGFARGGPRERFSKEMILKAEEGDYDWIRGVLRDDLASADVADAKGYTALAAAAVHCHTRVISLLLDSGADVNKCTDEGLTPLSMSFLLFYPAAAFQPNVAERTLPEPQEGATKGPAPPNPPGSPVEAAPEPELTDGLMPDRSSHELRQSMQFSGSEEAATSQSRRQSGESVEGRSSSLRWESMSGLGSICDVEKGLDDGPGDLDKCTECSTETNFQSNQCVHNFSIRLAHGILEKSARAYSMLKTPSFSAVGADKGTMRRMAQSMIE